MKPNRAPRPSIPKKPRLLYLHPHAQKLLLAGYILILLSLCDFAARLSSGNSLEPLLYIESYMGSVSSATILLWCGTLGMDWLEYTHTSEEA